MITWNDAATFAFRQNFEIPHTHQWEYACRGGTTTPWYSGADKDALVGNANVLDLSALRAGVVFDSPADFDDGFALHAPVGSFPPNPFGLFDMHGNVFEWSHGDDPADGVFVCGGAYVYGPTVCRTVNRSPGDPDLRTYVAGLRVVRPVID